MATKTQNASIYIYIHIYIHTLFILILRRRPIFIIIIIIIIIKCGNKIPMRLLFFHSCSITTMTHGLLDEFSLRFSSVCPGKRWESIWKGARKDSFHVSPTCYSITIPSFDVIYLFKASLNTARINKSFSEHVSE